MQDALKQREVVRTWIKLERYLSEFQTEEEMKKKGDYNKSRMMGNSVSNIGMKRPSSSKFGRSLAMRSGSGVNMSKQMSV